MWYFDRPENDGKGSQVHKGEYRTLYQIDGKRKVITIESIGTRGEVY